MNTFQCGKILGDDSLKMFVKCLREFDTKFCNVMNEGTDFTLRLEVRGNERTLQHCRVSVDEISRLGKKGKNLP